MNNTKLSVLVTDSDLRFLKIAKEKLKKRGFLVLTNSNSKETVKILKSIEFNSLLINSDKGDEKKILLDYIETLKVKPTVLYSSQFIVNESPLEEQY